MIDLEAFDLKKLNYNIMYTILLKFKDLIIFTFTKIIICVLLLFLDIRVKFHVITKEKKLFIIVKIFLQLIVEKFLIIIFLKSLSFHVD